MSGQKWFSVSVTAAREAEDTIAFALNELGALGIEVGDMPQDRGSTVTVVGYFDDPPEEPSLTHVIEHALVAHDLSGISFSTSLAEVEDRDWLAEWKKHWKPQTIGRFVIAPPWAEVDEPDKIVIRIEPNMAFGTGTHETTQLCLRAIEDVYRPGLSFLDVGTGTGILAIAAAKLAGYATESTENTEEDGTVSSGEVRPRTSPSVSSVLSVAKIAACDTDLEAVAIARENAAANGVGDLIEFIDGPLPSDAPQFDIVCANLTAGDILPILSLLLSKTRRTLILSGILAEQQDAVIAALRGNSVEDPNVETAGEWISVVCGTDAAASSLNVS